MVPEVLSKDSMTFPSERKEPEVSKFRKNDGASEAFLDSRRSRSLFGWRRRREEYGWSAWNFELSTILLFLFFLHEVD